MKNPVGLDLSRATLIIFFVLKNIPARQYFSYAQISSPRQYFLLMPKKIHKTIFFIIYTGRFFGPVYREENLLCGKP